MYAYFIPGKFLANGEDARGFLKKEENYPVSLKFGKSKLTTNERIMLASMFHSLFAIACKLSPVDKSSGIEAIEAESFKLHCYQTPTGIKFIVLTEPRVDKMDSLLKKVYELYADFAMKNPFYSLEMPIRCELFDANLQRLLEQTDKSMNYSGMSWGNYEFCNNCTIKRLTLDYLVRWHNHARETQKIQK